MLTARQWKGVDLWLIGTSIALLGIGFLVLYSASFQKVVEGGHSLVDRQMTWAIVGCLLAIVLILIDYHRWLEWAYFLYVANIVLLLLVTEVGVIRGGAQRWLALGGITIQPSEFAKITTVLALCRYLGSRQNGGSDWKTVFGVACIAGLPMMLVLRQPDLGTTLVWVPMIAAMLLVWGIQRKTLWTVVGAGLVTLPMLWFKLADYQRSRLLVFMNTDVDPLGAGYTINQSKIAIGSGGFFGKGWLSGTQNQLNFLPERHSDFIFSVVGEEWGFLGVSLVLALFGFFFIRALIVASQIRDPHGRLLTVGLVAVLATHVVVNTGMTIGLMPVVGLPLPFFSYGGSWMVTCLTAIGMILSAAARRPVF